MSLLCLKPCHDSARHALPMLLCCMVSEERLWGLQVSDASLAQMPEFRQRVDVLRRMQYLAKDDTVQIKARTDIREI